MASTTPGMTMVVPNDRQNEQVELQIEGIEAAIAEIDEALKQHSDG